MKIILSPAKKMVTDTDRIAPAGMPEFLDKTTEILDWMKSREKDESTGHLNIFFERVNILMYLKSGLEVMNAV